MQFIKDLDKAVLPEIFRGRPELKEGLELATAQQVEALCPTGAFSAEPMCIDLGRCVFCGECQRRAPSHIRFTNDHRMATNVRENLLVTPASPPEVAFDVEQVRGEIYRTYGRALKLREVSAGGDNSTEMELNASMNVNFDFGRYGVEFVASPRHADGVVVSGPITRNMADALEICYESVAAPKIIIMAGTDAISGGVFAGSPALDRSFTERYKPDLWLPGNPVHPLTFIDGVRKLLRHKR